MLVKASTGSVQLQSESWEIEQDSLPCRHLCFVYATNYYGASPGALGTQSDKYNDSQAKTIDNRSLCYQMKNPCQKSVFVKGD